MSIDKRSRGRFFKRGSVGSEALEQLESAVSEFEEQVRDVNARIDKRAGRPLWKAVAIGLLLGGVFLGSLLWFVELFVLFLTVLVVFAVLELAGALRGKERLRARWPLVMLSSPMVPITFLYGAEGQLWALVGAMVIAVLIRAGRSMLDPAARSTTFSDMGVAIMVLAYIPFLAGFAVLIASRQPNGVWWVLAGVIIVVSVDVSAYASGLSFGKTPLAPKISPKKTWEGFAGSFLGAILSGVLVGFFLLGEEIWVGALLGIVLLGSATLGDLVESLIKRDLEIKDISSWLPGHGGFLDRLDSMLPSMAMLYVMFQIFR
jgi:phosphatidate cytidylyltransferase